MKNQRYTLSAFLLNLIFSIIQFIGGILSNSVAVLSAAVEDLGEAAGFGICWYLEKLGKEEPEKRNSEDYARYSALGTIITTVILFFGSLYVIVMAISRFAHPADIKITPAICFALIGLLVNAAVEWSARKSGLRSKTALNHQLIEAVLSWTIVLIGVIVIRLANLPILDPILAICVGLYLIIRSLRSFKTAMTRFVSREPEEKIYLGIVPKQISAAEVETRLGEIPGVLGVDVNYTAPDDNGQTEVRYSLDCAKEDDERVRKQAVQVLKELGIGAPDVSARASEK